MRGEDRALFPIPFLEQISDWILEARKKVLTVQKSTRADQVAANRRMTDFNLVVIGIDNPGDLGSAFEEVPQALVHLSTRVIRRKYLDSKVGSTGKECPR